MHVQPVQRPRTLFSTPKSELIAIIHACSEIPCGRDTALGDAIPSSASLSLEDVDGSDDLLEVLEIEVPTMSGHRFDMKSFSEERLWQDTTNERTV